jgi:hypothetical protein
VSLGGGEPAAVLRVLLIDPSLADEMRPFARHPEPERQRLASWQSFVFSLIGIVGVVFGAILRAAVSGST